VCGLTGATPKGYPSALECPLDDIELCLIYYNILTPTERESGLPMQ